MNATPSFRNSSPVSSSQGNNRGEAMKYLAKSNHDFREASRKADAMLIRRAFDGPTQDAMAQRGSRALGVSPRQIINWMQCQHDMPSWAVKAVKHYLSSVERSASRIEGPQ